MGLINCPECNEKISSSTNQCIHCGYKFSVCPECESILEADEDICHQCGYKIKKTQSTTASGASKQQNTSIRETAFVKHISNWIKGTLFGWMHTIDIISKILRWSGWGTTGLFALIVFVFRPSSPTVLTIILAIFSISDSILSFLEDIFKRRNQFNICANLSNYSKSKNVNFEALIADGLSINYSHITDPIDLEKLPKSMALAIDSYYYESVPKSKLKIRFTDTVHKILSLIAKMLLIVFLTSNLETLLTSTFDFALYDGAWLLFAFVVVIAFKILLYRLLNQKLSQNKEFWMRTKFPLYADKYAANYQDADYSDIYKEKWIN